MNKKVLALLCILISSCTQLPTNRDEAKELAYKKLEAGLDKILERENPINFPEKSSYPVVDKLPGKPFITRSTIRSMYSFDLKGNILLSPGDYTFPVMTYCMRSAASSPEGHRYTLSKLEGKRAQIIRALNLKAPAKYFTDQIQMVSWAIQNGLTYEELDKTGKEIIDSAIPEHKKDLQESTLVKLEKQWDQIASISGGMTSSFSSSLEKIESELGETGRAIKRMREFKEQVREYGYDYERLRGLIDTEPQTKNSGETPWSKLSDNVYARFLTKESFQGIGYIQVRVVTNSLSRQMSSIENKNITLDLLSLLADPNSNGIQPLSFSSLIGFGGTIILTPALGRNSLAGALLLAALLSANIIDWNSFFDLADLLQDSNDPDVNKEIERGMKVLNQTHDRLEKPLKDSGVIDGNTRNTSSSNNRSTRVREYTKEGGEQQLEKDFNKLPGDSSSASDGTEIKKLHDGSTVVKRPRGPNTEVPTLETQSPSDPNTKVKVRYP